MPSLPISRRPPGVEPHPESSGAVALFHVVGVTPEAATLARENAARLGLDVHVVEGDLFEPLEGDRFDLIVSNPPYIAESEWADLPTDVRDHDPRMALVGGPEGTEIIERVVHEAVALLHDGGLLAVEIGETQGPAVLEMAAGAAYTNARVLKDLAGRDRYLFAERPGE